MPFFLLFGATLLGPRPYPGPRLCSKAQGERVTNRTRITRKDVAERAGVSVAVVSYVVNDGPRPVAPKTRAKVEKASRNWLLPNELARGLRLHRV
jgi:hypothetical protein